MNKKSLLGLSWEIKSKSKVNEINILDVLLKVRKLKKDFLDPKSAFDYSIFDLGINKKDYGVVVKRLQKAKDKAEKIIIYGDYDADGITSTAVLWEFLHTEGFNVMPYLPNRESDGYGLNENKLIDFKKENVSLIITVDNGISAGKAIKKAKSYGIDVIVIDHHQASPSQIRDTRYVIHATSTNASTIVWYLVKELGASKDDLNDYLAVAVIGTIADQVLLTGINRSFVKDGLDTLSNTKRIGLQSLIKKAGVKAVDFDTYTVGFVIAPRLNASGRIGDPMDALRLICTRKKEKADSLSEKLEKLNSKRQDVLNLSSVHASENNIGINNNIIIASDASYHEGIIGLIASNLVEKYGKPAIAISVGKKIAKGSARSIKGFDITKVLKEIKFLESVGGHQMAAGFSIKPEKLNDFIIEMNKIVGKKLSTKKLSPVINIDASVNMSDLSVKLIEKIEKLKPFGIGNFTPVFYCSDVIVSQLAKVGKNSDHLKITVSDEKGYVQGGIFFKHGDLFDKISKNNKVDLCFALNINEYLGKKRADLFIKDIRI